MPASRLKRVHVPARLAFFVLALMVACTIVITFTILYKIPEKIDGVGLILLKGGLKQILSPKNGVVEYYVKEEGDVIQKGEVVAFIKSLDEHETTQPIIAHADGIIAEIIAYPDTQVSLGQPLAIITHQGDPYSDLELIGFVSSLEGKKISPNMPALITPSIIDPNTFGYLQGEVTKVGRLPMSKAAIQSVIKIPEVAHYIREQIDAEPFVVNLSLSKDVGSKTGYAWTGPGPNFGLDSGIIADFFIITSQKSLAERLFPSLFRKDFGV